MPRQGGKSLMFDHLKVRIFALSKMGWLVWIYDFHYSSCLSCLFLCAVQSIKIQLSTFFCLATPVWIGLEGKDRSLNFQITPWFPSNKCPSYTKPIHTTCDPQTCVLPQRNISIYQADRLILVLWGPRCSRQWKKVTEVSAKQYLCLRWATAKDLEQSPVRIIGKNQKAKQNPHSPLN